ncbi:type VI secretion system baseplate subunit TssF [Microvirga sp. 0TCS3.31]
MNREFLDLFNQELALLQEHGAEFAAEYPGVAERLGGLVGDRVDPMISGLLEGAAFLAARVQLKLKHEFPEFTNNLLEQLVPHYLAPTPSALLVKIIPPYGDPALREGSFIARGAYVDATYSERERRVACRYRLCSDITVWPFEITSAEYHAAPGPLQALGLPVDSSVAAGLRLSLTHRTSERSEDEIPSRSAAAPEDWFAGCRTDVLSFHLLGGEAEAIALYEQLFASCIGVYFRYIDQFNKAVIVPAPVDCLTQIGFGADEALMPNDTRVFQGFDLLREYFLFPRKFLGFKLAHLRPVMRQLQAKSIDILFSFREANTRLAPAVQRSMFALYAAPAVNLFEMSADRIPVRSNQHEYHLVPDRSRPLDFEPHRVLDVYAHFHGGRDKVALRPLYSGPESFAVDPGLFYTTRRLPRRRTIEERKYGAESDYTGTEVFISITEPAGIDDKPSIAELSVKALCSNRHLPEHLPVGDGGADFTLLDNTALAVVCVDGPTPPREPIVRQLRSQSETAHTGAVAWRLINILSTNHLGLVQRGAGRNGQALREILSLFGNLPDSATERKIRGIHSVDSQPIVRRVRHRMGIGVARGLEVIVTLDERSFEGSGAFLLGAVLDRFFAEYAAINHFTQTVLRSVERGEIMRWPPRVGARGAL